MAKQKFELSTNLIDLSNKTPPEPQGDSAPLTTNPPIPPLEQKSVEEDLVTITIRVPRTFRSEMKAWCAQKDQTIVDTIKQSFELLKNLK